MIHHIQTEKITSGAHEESSPSPLEESSPSPLEESSLSPLEESSPSPLEESYTHGDLTNGDHVKPQLSLDISLQVHVCSPPAEYFFLVPVAWNHVAPHTCK